MEEGVLDSFKKRGMEPSQGARKEKDVIKATRRLEALQMRKGRKNAGMSVGKFRANMCGIWGCYYRGESQN